MITALTVYYNMTDLPERLLSSFGKKHDIPFIVIDGSDSYYCKKIFGFKKKYKVETIQLPYIHFAEKHKRINPLKA